MKSGETVTWREYSLHFEHQPGQTILAMSIETEVDGRRVLFTGDNFYRADQYSGSGGWSGMNRGFARRLSGEHPPHSRAPAGLDFGGAWRRDAV